MLIQNIEICGRYNFGNASSFFLKKKTTLSTPEFVDQST
jgi:hypothetical protein